MALSRPKKLLILALAVAVLAYPAWYLGSPLFLVTTGTDVRPAEFTTLVAAGPFRDGEPGHHAEGQASVLTDGSRYLLRFENFTVTNGPDLNVYLARAPFVGDGDVDLGSLKATHGSSNYLLPDGVDPTTYDYVVIWCVPFSVQFGYAELGTA